MPFTHYLNDRTATAETTMDTRPEVTNTDWRTSLPVLAADGITLRELTLEDAPSLLALLTTEEVSRFISPPPTTLEGFEQFIKWTHRRRSEGEYVCFGIVPKGMNVAVGLFQVKSSGRGFASAEWGFVLGRAFWGTGLFVQGAHLVLDFVFETVGVSRLEARSAVQNGRGNGALRKLGAIKEGVLRNSFMRHGVSYNQNMWSILESDWVAIKESGRQRSDEDAPMSFNRVAVA